MNFLWDIALRALKQGKNESDLFFAQAQEYSPFYEQAFDCLNEQLVSSNIIELNLFYRFADIFQAILAWELHEKAAYTEFRVYLIDAALHTLLYTDLRHGLTKREIYIRKILEELINGVYWKEAAQRFSLIEPQKQNRLASLVLTQMQTGSSLMLFRRSILVLFPDAILYQMKAERKNLLLYLKDKSTEDRRKMLQFAQDMFLPLSYKLRVFWEYHFGIIGVAATMRIDEIALY